EGGGRPAHGQGPRPPVCRPARRPDAVSRTPGVGASMLRILFYVAIVFLIGLGFAWLADRPGEMVITFNGYRYEVTLMVAAVIMAAIVTIVMLTWWLVKAIWNSPYTVSRYFRVRRRDRGYQALSTGMIAAGAGDAALARKKNREALKLISSDRE